MDLQRDIDYVLRTVESRDIRFIRLWFTDVLGRLKSFAISPEDLAIAFEEGIGFDGSSIEGFASREESDMLAFPDPTTFQVLPWRPIDDGVARIFCRIKKPNCENFEGDPREALRRVFGYAEELGYIMNVGTEMEYFYFADDKSPKLLDRAGYFDLTPDDPARDLRRSTTLMLEKMSIPVEYSYHSIGHSQQGLSLRHSEALAQADNIMTAKYVIRLEAFNRNVHASFMPKPLPTQPGSGLFLHESLLDREGHNVFWDPDDKQYYLSDIARHYIAGVLKYAPEFMAITNPTVNSYKRISNNAGDVPMFATWGLRNRDAMCRIPMYKPSKSGAARIELRLPDDMANPYLAIAVTLAAGLKGIEDKLELAPEVTLDMMGMSASELESHGYARLPRSLGEALDNFEHSELMRETLGDHIHSFFLRKKRDEWERYNSTVTDWEIERYIASI